jgi:CspA family cold shock protein
MAPSSGSENPPGVDAIVKWFKDDKGYGFVEVGSGRSDAFLHASILHAAGVGTVSAGARLRVVVRDGPKGPQVAHLVQANASGTVEQPRRSLRNRASLTRRTQPDPGAAVSMAGRVKWFDDAKGFGFVLPDDCGKDIFVHVSTLGAAGLARLVDGQAVTMRVVETPRGREAIAIAV